MDLNIVKNFVNIINILIKMLSEIKKITHKKITVRKYVMTEYVVYTSVCYKYHIFC